jgi:hypothetical protein
VELWDDASNDLIIQSLRIVEWEFLEAVAEVYAPLTHNVVGCDLLCFRVMGGASYNYIVGVGVTIYGC